MIHPTQPERSSLLLCICPGGVCERKCLFLLFAASWDSVMHAFPCLFTHVGSRWGPLKYSLLLQRRQVLPLGNPQGPPKALAVGSKVRALALAAVQAPVGPRSEAVPPASWVARNSWRSLGAQWALQELLLLLCPGHGGAPGTRSLYL